MKLNVMLLSAGILCAVLTLSAQEKSPVKFGKITPEDFTIKEAYDSNANAVVMADIGSSVYEGNMKGWFSIIYKRTKRIKLINKNGFEAADIKIQLYSSGNAEEKLEDLKAHTYNPENGRVVEIKLDAASVFKDKLDDNNVVKKFTFPGVKEGSVIEYSYTIKSDFYASLRPWVFQSEYPCLWSEYEVSIPDFFQFVTLNQGYLSVDVKSSSSFATYRVTIPGGSEKNDQWTGDARVDSRRWLVKNIPPLALEKYTSALTNYIGKVEFQLARVQFQGSIPEDKMGNWVLMGKQLMEHEYFGQSLSKNNNWLDDELKIVTKGAVSKLEKAKKIFAYVRDNLTCTDHSAVYLETTLKEAFKKHNGNVADINLLLVTMLRHEDITADPLILSTKSNGFTSEIYPLLTRFNYVICHARIDDVLYELDASSPYNGFGKLPPGCYNGHARIITKDAALPVYFESDSLKEKKMTSVFIGNGEKKDMIGSFKSQLGYYESLDLREEIKNDAAAYFKKIKTRYGFEIAITETGIDSLNQPEMPAGVHYDFAFTPAADESILYFNPMMSEGYKENPFGSADRKYPVEMPYTTDETYLLNMEIPLGYTVEEIPKSARVAFNEDDGFFEYLVQKSDDTIMLRSRIKLNRATFTPEDYEGLRAFFAYIVKKQSEQIVLKKK